MKDYQYTLGVDAGNISIIGPDTIKKYGLRYKSKKRDYSHMFFRVRLKKDENITIVVSDTYIDGDSQSFTVEASKAGTYYVGDACYLIKKWNEFLEDTDYLNNMPEDCTTVNTGGDGLFKVTAEVF
jgi:hypothetical protein